MAKLTVELPDDLVHQVQSAGQSVEAILVKALTQYIAIQLPVEKFTESLTWQLCGRFSVAEPDAATHAMSADTQVNGRTNYAEQVDDVLYNGF